MGRNKRKTVINTDGGEGRGKARREERERMHGHKYISNLIMQDELFLYSSYCLSECQSQRHIQVINITAASWKGYVQNHCCERVVFLPAENQKLF